MAISVEHNLFPDLPPRAEIAAKVSLLEKDFLDESPLGYPSGFATLLGRFHYLRLSGQQARFVETEGRLEVVGIPRTFVTAAYNRRLSLHYIIRCRNCQVEVLLGTLPGGLPDLAALIDAGISPGLHHPFKELTESTAGEYPLCAVFTGIPSPSRSRNAAAQPTTTHPPVDAIITTLLREDWMLVIQASPLMRSQTHVWIETCAREIKDIRVAYSSEMQKTDRMVAHYLDLLEKSITRLASGKREGMWQTGVYFFSATPDTVSRGAALLMSAWAGEKSIPEPVRCSPCSRDSTLIPFINSYNSGELHLLLSLPGREFPGFGLRETPPFDTDFRDISAPYIKIGDVLCNGLSIPDKCVVPVDDLTRHGLVAGITGSGKTNTVFNLLTQLSADHDRPFLVIEPVKSEYRALLDEIDQLLIFTLGDERPELSSPFRLNPFEFPEGIPLLTHIDCLKTVFNASFVMYAPMPYVLEDCLYGVYEDRGWNLVTSENPRGRHPAAFPTLLDLYRKIEPTVDQLGYQDRTTADIKAALQVRIRNLCLGGRGMMLNTGSSVPFEQIMSRPTVLELKYLGSDEEKAFMMGLILTAVWEHYESRGSRTAATPGRLRHLTVIEEAHRLLRNTPIEKSSEEAANNRGKAVETFTNMLAEIRAHGEGVLVVEQIPTKLSPDVIKNSSLKVLHRMVATEDRDVMGSAMNLDPQGNRRAVSLANGEAIFFSDGLDRPMLIRGHLSSVKESAEFSGDKVFATMKRRFFDHHCELLRPFVACGECPARGSRMRRREAQGRGTGRFRQD